MFALQLLLAPASAGPGLELGFGWALVRMLVALVVVCAVAYLLLRYGLRRLAAPRLQGRTVRVVERCPLSASRALWVVEVGERRYLIGEAEAAISLLAELPRDGPCVTADRAQRGRMAEAAPSSLRELAGPAPRGSVAASAFLQLLRRRAAPPAATAEPLREADAPGTRRREGER